MFLQHAPAKINLSLRITGRRPDGYHLLDSLVVFAGAHDTVTASPGRTLSLNLSGPFAAALGAGPDNLVLRAARALAEAAGIDAHASLHLEKNLPVASGIGGGSSDAAAALRALSRLWGLDLAPAAWHSLAARLGADVPVCLDPAPRHMAGIGDILAPAPAIPECGILLVNPGAALATQAVFQARAPIFSAPPAWPAGWPDAAAMAAFLAPIENDLQAAAIALCPAIGQVLDTLAASPGTLLARMSGSGATCFALFDTPAAARRAAGRAHRPGWWSWGGPLYAGPADT